MSVSVNLTKEQNDVINVRDRDVLVAASAGSGKTFVVANRIISRVVNDNIDIDRVLVVTFTNAAASELKLRILNGFYEELKRKDLSKDKKSHLKRQLSLINRAQISTIHSFCLSIIKSNFYMLELDPNVKTLDENKAKLMLLETIDEIIEEEYENKTDIFLKVLEFYRNEENIIQNLEKIYNFSMSMSNPNEWLNNTLNKYKLDEDIKDLSNIDFGEKIICSIKERLELACNELKRVCNKIRSDKDFETRLYILENVQEKIERLQQLSLYDEIYKYIHNNLDFPRLPSSKCVNEELKKEVSDVKKKVINELKDISKMIYKDTEGILEELDEMYDIVNWYVNKVSEINRVYSNKKKKAGYIDFADYEHLALKVLEDEKICEEYTNKYDEIYIDEYQDTSYIQENILNKIAKNNRIMVGDVKQSIYSFRNAEPRLFNEKYTEYELYNEESKNSSSVKIILSKNFRSRQVVLDSINDVFKKIMSNDVGQCEYGEQEYLVYGEGYDKETEKECVTEINIIETENEETNTQDNDIASEEIEEISNVQKEAYMISEKIQNLIASDFKLYDAKKKEYRNVEYKDIVILLRAVSSKASIYENVFKKNNIPAFSDTSDSFYNGQEVGLILSFLKIIDNVYDDISLVSTMYSIIGKFTVDDLVYIRNYDKHAYFYNALIKAYADEENIDKELYNKIDNFLKLIQNITSYLNAYTLAETILKIYENTGIYYSFYLEEMGKQKCANLDSLVEVARNFEKEERSSIYEFIKYVENIKGRKTKGTDTPKLLGEGENVVRILTIHKSKGLEYPIVFLADTSKKYNTLDMSSDILLDENYGIGLDTYNTDLRISYSNIIKQAIKEKIKDKTLSEEERLLYVAMTRAKEKLYIYGTVKNYEKLIDKLFTAEKGKISPVVVKNCNSYLKLIMLALSSNITNNFALNILSSGGNVKEKILESNKKIDRNLSCKDKFIDLCKDIKRTDIDKTFNTKYSHIDSINIKKKYTVTEIKNSSRKNQDKEQLENNMTSLEEFKPKCIETKITNMNYGTIIHKILEKIDYSKFDIKYIEGSIDVACEGIVDISVSKIKDIILKYITNKEVIEIVKDAIRVSKEQPFVIYDDLEDIESLRLEEKTYIQGVIDLYIKAKDNKNVIIDFKTDRVENEEELIQKYKNQLCVYKKGIELSIKEKVDKMYIYSFCFNKLIEIN